jgi:hypothetical protein
MFDYIKAARAFKKDCDNFSTPYDTRGEEKSNVTVAEFSNRHHAKRTVRFAACTAVAAAVVLTGTVTLPNLLQSKNSNSFAIVVKAADAPNGKTLTPNQKVKLNTKAFDSTSSADSTSVTAVAAGISDCFTISGKNVKSITYKASSDQLMYISENYSSQVGSTKPYCTIKIPKSEFKSNDLMGEFKSMWSGGKLDQYKNKYFGGKDIDTSIYNIGFRYDTDTVTAVITKLSDISASKDSDISTGNAFTVDSNHQKNVMFTMSGKNEQAISNELNNSNMTIAITVTFNDGQTQTKTVGIEFDSLGLPYLTLKS